MAITKADAQRAYDTIANDMFTQCIDAIDEQLRLNPAGSPKAFYAYTRINGLSKVISLPKGLASRIKEEYTRSGWEVGDVLVEYVTGNKNLSITIQGIQ